MFIFHEGLPRSGKSYEAVVKHIIPILARRRKVYAYIEGLDHARIAQFANLTLTECEDLLTVLTRDQVPEVYKHVSDNSFVVLDEMQNFFPSGRDALSDAMTQFVTEHGHRGLDILGMGQSIKDIHVLWRRRCDRKMVFSKLDALSMASKYRVFVYKAVKPEVFELVTKSTCSYDPQYYGTYASHVSEDIIADTYKDSRSSVFSSLSLKALIPIVLIILYFGLSTLNKLFFASASQAQPETPAQPITPQPAPTPHTQPHPPPVTPTPSYAQPKPIITDQPKQSKDYIIDITDRWRIRLGGVLHNKNMINGVVEWYDSSYRLQESLTINQLKALGWSFDYRADLLYMTKNETEYILTAWPMDPMGKVPMRSQQQIGGLL